MGRKEQRIKKRLEKNPVKELNKIQNRYSSPLFWKFAHTEDPRHSSYITYTNRMMLGTLYYKGIAGIDSMQEMTEQFNDETVSKNLSMFIGEKAGEYVPHHVTENEYLERLDPMELEEIKQDCETKAFLWLAGRIKKRFPRLPILLLADSLYASKTVMDLCREYKWEFLIRYKKGSIPSIMGEYEKIPEKMAETGRKRWKIENEGFNRQKNWQGSITHTCSWNDQAQKNHYLMAQISDFMKQLYEYYYLRKNGIEKKQKNISSDLLESFGQQITKEDIFPVDEYTQSFN